jgi:hypothetical protein
MKFSKGIWLCAFVLATIVMGCSSGGERGSIDSPDSGNVDSQNDLNGDVLSSTDSPPINPGGESPDETAREATLGAAAIETDHRFVDRENASTTELSQANDSAQETAAESESCDEDLPSMSDLVKENEKQQAGPETPVRAPEVHTIEIPNTWKRLSPDQEIWIDTVEKQVIAGGYICQNAAPLEVFICPAGTKEHESVVAVHAQSFQVHAALLALGAEPGHPVQWLDEYKPVTGPEIKITVMWKDGDQLVRRRGQEMVLNMATEKTMEQPWVFGGSITETDPESGITYYFADGGELVCLSNFSTAAMDVPVQSSDANEGLMFRANTANIPEIGTKVYVLFQPLLIAPTGQNETSSQVDQGN